MARGVTEPARAVWLLWQSARTCSLSQHSRRSTQQLISFAPVVRVSTSRTLRAKARPVLYGKWRSGQIAILNSSSGFNARTGIRTGRGALVRDRSAACERRTDEPPRPDKASRVQGGISGESAVPLPASLRGDMRRGTGPPEPLTGGSRVGARRGSESEIDREHLANNGRPHLGDSG
jgi:hypothetical protein